jgi:hypothetical protein
MVTLRGCIQKFPDWPPGARTANCIALCCQVQLYRYFISQSSEFCRHNPLGCFWTCVRCCKRIIRYRLSPETFGYTLTQDVVPTKILYAFVSSIRVTCPVHRILLSFTSVPLLRDVTTSNFPPTSLIHRLCKLNSQRFYIMNEKIVTETPMPVSTNIHWYMHSRMVFV